MLQVYATEEPPRLSRYHPTMQMPAGMPRARRRRKGRAVGATTAAPDARAPSGAHRFFFFLFAGPFLLLHFSPFHLQRAPRGAAQSHCPGWAAARPANRGWRSIRSRFGRGVI